jgi:uncharacterized protein (TIRG00374 family)
MSRTTRTLIGIAISAIALYLAMPPRDEWGNVAAAFARVHYAYLVPIALLSAYSIVVRCQRWQLLLRPVGPIPFLALLSATSIGFLCNMVLPLRVGEVIRPVLLANRTHVPVSSVFASVLLERLLDMLTILLLLGLVMCLVPVSSTIRQSGIAFLVLAIVAVAMVVALQRRNPTASDSFAGCLARMPAKVRDRADAALTASSKGCRASGRRVLLRILGYSVFVWTVIARRSASVFSPAISTFPS